MNALMLSGFFIGVLCVAVAALYFKLRRLTRHVAQQDKLIKGLLESNNVIASLIRQATHPKAKPKK